MIIFQGLAGCPATPPPQKKEINCNFEVPRGDSCASACHGQLLTAQDSEDLDMALGALMEAEAATDCGAKAGSWQVGGRWMS